MTNCQTVRKEEKRHTQKHTSTETRDPPPHGWITAQAQEPKQYGGSKPEPLLGVTVIYMSCWKVKELSQKQGCPDHVFCSFFVFFDIECLQYLQKAYITISKALQPVSKASSDSFL